MRPPPIRRLFLVALLACGGAVAQTNAAAPPDGAKAAAPSPAPAASAPPPAGSPPAVVGRPKIGLVLSGGGARGAAHVGVLRVLEELRVPVDVIVGTSMGSIVGAAYATGMSVAEMEQALPRINARVLVSDEGPREDETMRQKADDQIPYLIPEIGVNKDGIVLPKGLITGIALEGELRDLVKVATVRSFDELPIPFRAVATDIGTGEMVVLKEGSVVRAIRASMSVPGAVAPVEIGSRQLVDGGLVRNLPVDVARAMGAEIVIAVNLGTPLLRPEQITSVLSVTEQMINILTEQNVARSLRELRPQDVLIVPALGNFSATDFDNLAKAVPVGEAAARAVADRLRALSIPPAAYAQLRREQAAPTDSAPVVVRAIRVEGTQRVSNEIVLQAMRTQVGSPLDRETIDLDLRRIYSRGDFETVNYTVDEVDGQTTLVVLVKEKPATSYFRAGLQLEADIGKQSDFSLYASFRMKSLNAWGAEWRSDAELGTNVLLATEWYQPLGPSQYFFVTPKLRYLNTPWRLFEDNVQLAQYQDQRAYVQLDVGANVIEYGTVALGAQFGQRRFTLEQGSLRLPEKGSVDLGALALTARVDRLDSIKFPHRGYAADASVYASLSQLGASDSYNKWEAGLNGAHSWGRHTLEAQLKGGGRIGSNPIPFYDLFPLGGFLNLSGLQRQQLQASSYTFGRLGYRTRIAEFTLFDGAYIGASLEGAHLTPLAPTIWNGQVVKGTLDVPAAALYFGVDSPLGPLYLGLGYANGDNKAIYLFLGRP
jgi:NTE family protein